MKIIDLLNKIANGEEVPKYIQYYNMVKKKVDVMMVCTENIFYKLDQLEIQLNSRIESVEEEKKIPERIELEPLNLKDDLQRQIEVVHYENIMISNAVNEIIDYLKSKGDE